MSPAKIFKAVIGIVVMVNIAIVLYVVLSAAAPKTAPPSLPNPNGYDYFVRAGRMLINTATTNDYRDWSREDLAAFVATNAEALTIAHQGLAMECRALDVYNSNGNFQQLSLMKRLGLALTAEGWLAKSENRTNDSIRCFEDCMTLGVKESTGGVMITKLVGIACENIGRSALRYWSDRLDANQCREIVAALRKLDASEEPFENAVSNEDLWVRKNYSFMTRIGVLVMYRQRQDSLNRARLKFRQNVFGRRQTMIDFAERAYELEQGHRPAKLEDLVPDYLKELPSTNIAGTNLAFHL
jgi:hypothetical protein